MGELRPGTAGLADRYYARRGALGPVDPQVERERFGGWGWDETRRYAEEDLGAALSGCGSEVTSVREIVAEPGSFLAISNGDPGANNSLIDEPSDGRIIDWEFAGYRHALTDIACFYVPGPMWMRVGSPVESRLEMEYRQVLADAIPQAGDDATFGSGVAAACIVMGSSGSIGSRG
jgi:hypothetical protein